MRNRRPWRSYCVVQREIGGGSLALPQHNLVTGCVPAVSLSIVDIEPCRGSWIQLI